MVTSLDFRREGRKMGGWGEGRKVGSKKRKWLYSNTILNCKPYNGSMLLHTQEQVTKYEEMERIKEGKKKK